MDFEAIKKAAQSYETAMTKCLRELVAIPALMKKSEPIV